MAIKNKNVDPIPEKFDSYEDAAEFWGTHDTTDYPEAFETIQYESSFQGRQYEIEIPEELLLSLRQKARQRGVTVNQLATTLLQQQIRALS